MLSMKLTYFVVMLDNFKSFADGAGFGLLFFGVISLIAYIITKIVYGVLGCETLKHSDGSLTYDGKCRNNCLVIYKNMKILSICLLIPGVLFVILNTLTPNTKQLATIVVVPAIVNTASESENLKKIPEELTLLASEWLHELRPYKEKISEATEGVKEAVEDAVKGKVTETIERASK